MKTLIRLHQLLLILAILSGCYAPDVRDCTVTCTGVTDCASGQVCGNDGFCAAPDVAGGCVGGVDAAMRVTLRVTVDGNGKVDIPGAGSYGGSGPDDCMISVPRGTVNVNAITLQTDHAFDRWTTAVCTGQTSMCTFTANTMTTVGAKFR